MALLDMQGMASTRGNERGCASDLSLLLCDSTVSFTLCL
jgi:hypothetical protein